MERNSLPHTLYVNVPSGYAFPRLRALGSIACKSADVISTGIQNLETFVENIARNANDDDDTIK